MEAEIKEPEQIEEFFPEVMDWAAVGSEWSIFISILEQKPRESRKQFLD